MEKTPFELWYRRKLSLKHMKLLGCVAYALILNHQANKLDQKQNGASLLDNHCFPNVLDYMFLWTIIESRHIKFLEDSFDYETY